MGDIGGDCMEIGDLGRKCWFIKLMLLLAVVLLKGFD